MVMLLVYLNRPHYSASEPAVTEIAVPANYSVIMVPKFEAHRTPKTWPTHEVADASDTPYSEDDSQVTTGSTPHTDLAPNSVPPFFGETREMPASESPATQPAASALEPVVNVSSLEEEVTVDTSTLAATTAEEVADNVTTAENVRGRLLRDEVSDDGSANCGSLAGGGTSREAVDHFVIRVYVERVPTKRAICVCRQ